MGHDHLERSADGGNRFDHGPQPFFVNLPSAARENANFRAALWTGMHLQMTLMHLPPCSEIGAECHADTDQLIRVEEGCALVRLGSDRDSLNRHLRLCEGDTIFVPCGTWHNVINVGNCPLKLSSVYAPPHHPAGTIHPTRPDAERKPY